MVNSDQDSLLIEHLNSMDGNTIGKWIIFVGLGLILFGFLIWIGSKLGAPVGKLPGDVTFQKGKFSLHFPLATSLILSILLTIIINLIIWLFRK
jgi:hypothetical protein